MHSCSPLFRIPCFLNRKPSEIGFLDTSWTTRLVNTYEMQHTMHAAEPRALEGRDRSVTIASNVAQGKAELGAGRCASPAWKRASLGVLRTELGASWCLLALATPPLRAVIGNSQAILGLATQSHGADVRLGHMPMLGAALCAYWTTSVPTCRASRS